MGTPKTSDVGTETLYTLLLFSTVPGFRLLPSAIPTVTLSTMTSHSEFGERTPGSEVAKIFADRIRGKTSE
jgi:hypothetical protein